MDDNKRYELLSEAELAEIEAAGVVHVIYGVPLLTLRRAIATIRDLQDTIREWQEAAGWLAYPDYFLRPDMDAEGYVDTMSIDAGDIRAVRKLMGTEQPKEG